MSDLTELLRDLDRCVELGGRATAGPWYVRDFRATEMRRLGWTGPAIDRILITCKDGPEIEACNGASCVVARIQFDNRPEEMGEISANDAEIIAALRNLLHTHGATLRELVAKACAPAPAAVPEKLELPCSCSTPPSYDECDCHNAGSTFEQGYALGWNAAVDAMLWNAAVDAMLPPAPPAQTEPVSALPEEGAPPA